MPFEWYLAHIYGYIFEVMSKSITHFLNIFFTFQQLQTQIVQINRNGDNTFCYETLQIHQKLYLPYTLRVSSLSEREHRKYENATVMDLSQDFMSLKDRFVRKTDYVYPFVFRPREPLSQPCLKIGLYFWIHLQMGWKLDTLTFTILSRCSLHFLQI